MLLLNLLHETFKQITWFGVVISEAFLERGFWDVLNWGTFLNVGNLSSFKVQTKWIENAVFVYAVEMARRMRIAADCRFASSLLSTHSFSVPGSFIFK